MWIDERPWRRPYDVTYFDIDGKRGGLMDGGMDGCLDGRRDGWMDVWSIIGRML